MAGTQKNMKRQQPCRFGLNCTRENCSFIHPSKTEEKTEGQKQPCRFGLNCTRQNCSFVHPSKTEEKTEPCRFGLNCTRQNCSFVHPSKTQTKSPSKIGPSSFFSPSKSSVPCPNEEKCCEFSCRLTHPKSRKAPCASGKDCTNCDCAFIHPTERETCHESCLDYDCELFHPFSRQKCLFAGQCNKSECQYLHPPERQICPDINDCRDYLCPFAHSTLRPGICPNFDECVDVSCGFLHPIPEDVCPARENCKNYDCPKTHPSTRTHRCLGREKCRKLDCQFLHPTTRPGKCSRLDDCPDYSCLKIHSASRKARCVEHCRFIQCPKLHPPSRPTPNLRFNVCPDPDDCDDFDCDLFHNSTRNKKCMHGASCGIFPCVFLHPLSRLLCTAECTDFDCELPHPKNRTKKCLSEEDCYKVNCTYLHPASRVVCSKPDNCPIFSCSKVHSEARKKLLCPKPECENFNCPLIHGPTRVICPNSKKCKDFDCSFVHHPDRPPPPVPRKNCDLGEDCKKFLCKLIHPPSRMLCPNGKRCSDYDCSCVHPPNRSPLCECIRRGCPNIHRTTNDDDSDDESVTSVQSQTRREQPRGPPTRSLEKRNQLKEQAKLPILKCRDIFCRRLVDEGVLIVTAETGSGKTTQLPQYCADFPELSRGLVICTQPRAIAAISISERISDEYDGTKVGRSVGYAVGGKEVSGNKIMLMTDAALIRLAQQDPTLSDVSVLMIDEAHERSLNTDIVLGIAKYIRTIRPDFRVLVASATIDPAPFLQFFFEATASRQRSLDVAGRTFPVSLEEVEVQSTGKYIFQKRIDMLVPTVLKALKTHKEGHCLAFLPGAQEVDSAVKAFRSQASQDFQCFPLYGSLPPEEQKKVISFDPNSKKRMVVFCTNIAETSLTVPGVKIVVDTGLAKEATYDPTRRINVLQLVNISKSSANQRKGRAGRTSAGHCIRLFSLEEDCTRDNIEPEILRSSLDKVVLQLCVLNQDPRIFPLMDRPQEALIQASLNMLSRFRCLDSRWRVTPKGLVFNNLDFDPRMSNFIFQANDSKLGVLATQIASILTAPGSIFFMGSGKEGRQVIKDKIGERASDHQSDLFYYQKVFQGWLQAGAVMDGKCMTCRKPAPLTRGCRKCRVAYSFENSLNNKVLEVIEQNVSSVLKRHPMEVDQTLTEGQCVELIGTALLSSFPEQICEVIIPEHPAAGGFLIDSRSKCLFSSVSFLTNKLGPQRPQHNQLICMSLTELPSGLLIVDQIHPLIGVPPSERGLRMKVCYSDGPLHPSFADSLSKEFSKLKNKKEPKDKDSFVFVKHDMEQENQVVIFGPEENEQEIANFARQQLELMKEREQNFPFEYNDKASAIFTSGLRLSGKISLETMKKFKILQFPPHCSSDAELKTWLNVAHSIPKNQLATCKFINNNRNGKPKFEAGKAVGGGGGGGGRGGGGGGGSGGGGGGGGQVDDADEDEKKELKDPNYFIVSFLNEAYGEELVQSSVAEVFLTEKFTDNLGKTIRFKFDGDVSELQELFQRSSFPVSNLTNKSKGKFGIKLNNLPLYVTEGTLRSAIRGTPKKLVFRSSAFTNFAFLEFESASTMDSALRALQRTPFCTESFSIYPSRKPGAHPKIITPELTTENSGSNEYEVTFTNVLHTEKALKAILANESRFSDAHCYASLLILNPEFYPNLGTLIQRIAENFEVQSNYFVLKSIEDKSPPARASFTGTSAQACRQSALALERATRPLIVRATTKKQRYLYTEIQSSGDLKRYLSRLDEPLHVEYFVEKTECVGFKFFGSTLSQGSVMRWVSSQLREFDSRFRLIEFQEMTWLYFSPGRRGHQKLMALESVLALKEIGGSIDVSDSKISILLPKVLPSEEELDFEIPSMDSIAYDIHILQIEFGAKKQSRELTFCSICGEENGCSALSICGHYYCSTCLHDHAKQTVESNSHPVCCVNCDSFISMKDIRSCFNPSELSSLLRSVLKVAVENDHSHGLGICPVDDCGRFSDVSRGYSQCLDCGQQVCVQCGLIGNNDVLSKLHIGASCDQFLKLKRKEMRRRAAEESWSPFNVLTENAIHFVLKHFDPSVGRPTDMHKNPGLQSGCPSMQQFCEGLLLLSGNDDFKKHLNSAVFGWHGTTSDAAVRGICHGGLDPRRRSDQLHGPGEYFAQYPSTAMGYSGGLKRLIVFAILQCPEFKKVEDFCYVVNNPVDGSCSYNVPVLVVDYEPMDPPTWTRCDLTPLPGRLGAASMDLGDEPGSPREVWGNSKVNTANYNVGEEVVVRRSKGKLDLVFCLDCTGSMSSTIKGCQDSIVSLANTLMTTEGQDVRFTLIPYRDHGGGELYCTKVYPFTRATDQMLRNVQEQFADGGADTPEAVAAALYDALMLDWREDAAKLVVIMADAPPHGMMSSGDSYPRGDPDGKDPLCVAREMAGQGVLLYSLVTGHASRDTLDIFSALSFMTGGRCMRVSDSALLQELILTGARENVDLEAKVRQALSDASNQRKARAATAAASLSSNREDSKATKWGLSDAEYDEIVRRVLSNASLKYSEVRSISAEKLINVSGERLAAAESSPTIVDMWSRWQSLPSSSSAPTSESSLTDRIKKMFISREAKASKGPVIVECFKEGSKIRTRIVSPGYDTSKDCIFPTDKAKKVGERYRVDKVLDVGTFYSVKGSIDTLL